MTCSHCGSDNPAGKKFCGECGSPLQNRCPNCGGNNPPAMEETVQVLLDEGVLVRNGTTKLTRPLADLKIPPTVQAILAARIDRLPADAKELLQTLATIGREFTLSLIRAVVPQSGQELRRLLHDLQLGEFIYEQPSVADEEWVFKHALTQEVAYNSVLLEQRKLLHERIGKALEALYADSIDEHLTQLAHHYGRSANVDAGMLYLTQAGKQKMDEARKQSLARDAGASAGDTLEATRAIHLRPEPAPQPWFSEMEEPSRATRSSVMDRFVGKRRQGTPLESVAEIWRYPVKSMAGEEIPTAIVTAGGLLGDRAYALVDRASNRVATVRTWAVELLNYRAHFVTEPELGTRLPDLRITSPGGMTFNASGPEVHAHLSAAFGRNLTLMMTAPSGLVFEFPAGTIGGTHSNATEWPIAAGASPGAFFDYGCVHLIATATLDHLQRAYPQGRFDVRRFRPNLVIGSQAEPFIENSWIGRTLAIGDEVVLRVTIPCPRCVTMTLPQGDLPHDPGILRTVAQHNMREVGQFGTLPTAGVYADVLKAGTIRRGAALHLLD